MLQSAVIRSDGRSSPFQFSAKLACFLGVLRFEGQDRDWRLQEDGKPIRVFLPPNAVGDAVLQFELNDGRERQRALWQLALEALEKVLGFLFQDCNDDVRIKTDHLSNKESSFGIGGCSRPLSMNGTSL